ncbi:MAG: cytochrome c, partial [Nitrospira sp.]|nr:cytochrome c [Nitrospira sp.]
MGLSLLIVAFAAAVDLLTDPAHAADEAVLRPRLPIGQIEEARTWANPLPATEDTIEKGKKLFHGKAF